MYNLLWTYFVLWNIFGAQNRHFCKFIYHGLSTAWRWCILSIIPACFQHSAVRSSIYWLRQQQLVTKVRTLLVMALCPLAISATGDLLSSVTFCYCEAGACQAFANTLMQQKLNCEVWSEITMTISLINTNTIELTWKQSLSTHRITECSNHFYSEWELWDCDLSTWAQWAPHSGPTADYQYHAPSSLHRTLYFPYWPVCNLCKIRHWGVCLYPQLQPGWYSGPPGPLFSWTKRQWAGREFSRVADH